MDKLRCVDVRSWIQEIILSKEPTSPDPLLAAHIARCQLCRGAFVLLAAKLVDLPSLAAPISCRQSEDDLAAFIEHELEEGSAAAIRTYPHVWWHVWTCEDCSETYRVTRSQLMRQQSHVQAISKVAAVPIASAPRRAPMLHFPRHFLHQALAASIPARAATRGRGGQSYILAEQDHAGAEVTVRIQRQPDGEWQIDVIHQPPLIGSLVMTLGTNIYRARFNAQGRAIVHDLPFALLTAPDGPGLEVDIEPDAEQASPL